LITAATALLVVFGALALFAWIGLRAGAPRTTVEDYLVARGSQRAGTLGLSFLASGLGAWILFAPPEVGAFVGLAGVLGYALAAAAPIAAFGPLGRRLRTVAPGGHSLAEFVRLRFGRTVHAYVVAVSILYMLVFVTAELTAVGAVMGILTGADGRIAVVAVAVVTLGYTAYGGLRASLRTDRWQGLLLGALLAIGTVAVLTGIGGGSPVGGLDPQLLRIDRVGIEVAITLVLAVTAANLFHQGYWQRVWAARDAATLSRGSALGALATIPVVAVVGLLGLIAASSGLELGAPPAPFFALLAGVGPWVAVVVLLLAVCLVTSSVDTLENALAALVVAERPALGLTGARLVTVGLVVPATLVAVQGLSVLRLFLVADLLCATVAAPALLGLWRRASARGALAGAAAGVAGAIVPGWVSSGSLGEGLLAATFPDAVPTLGPFAGAILASAAVTLAWSLAERRNGDGQALVTEIPTLDPAPDPPR
jgi:solute:Na+ symporter, SSS family